MKHQRHLSGSSFGPKPRRPSRITVGNGSRRKQKPNCRFRSLRMQRITEDVKKSHASMQHISGNIRKGEDFGATNKAYKHSSKICPPMMAGDKLNRSIYNEKDQQGTNVLRGVKLRQWDTDGAKGISPQVEMDPESGQVFPLKNLVKATVMRSAYKNNASKSLEISKMEKELLHANDNKISRSQQNDLKVMPGLRRNSKGKVKLDQGPSTRMHGRDRLIDRDSRANDDNVSRNHPLIEENHTLHGDNGRERENPTWRAMKKQRKYIDAYEDEDHNGDQSSEDVLVAEDSTRFGSKDAEVSMPFVDDCVRNQFYCCSKPIDEHVWSGILKIGNKDYIPLDGHLSTKSCEKVHKLSKLLSRVVQATKLPRSKVWPNRWEGSRPTHDNIGLYFFPHKMRPDKYYDQLLEEVMENDLALRSIIGDAEMLMFPSSLLPERYRTFQMKHYLWGVFKPREVEAKQGAALRDPDHNTGATIFASDATSTITPGSAVAATISASTPTEDSTDARAVLGSANHGRDPSSGVGAPPGRMAAFVVRQTPRLEPLIREICKDAALVMHGENTSGGTWPSNMATVMQRANPASES